MSALKEATIEAIKKLPDDCTPEDILYEMKFLAKVFRGLKDIEEGRVLTTNQILDRIDNWAK
jgi:predicted transcriptional regulator